MGNRNRPPKRPAAPNLPSPSIEPMTDTTGKSVAPPSSVQAPNAPERPLYKCTVSVFADKHTIDGLEPGSADLMTSKLFGRSTVQVWPKNKDMPKLVTATVSPRRWKTETKTWATKWRDRVGAGFLWLVFMSWLFRDRGIVGELLSRAGASSSWEPWILVAFVAVLLIWLPRRGVAGALLASLYIVCFPLVVVGITTAKLVGALVLLNRITKILGSFTYRGANWLLMIVSCAAIAKSQSQAVIDLAAGYLIIGTVYLVGSNFYWVTRPLSTVFRLLEWVDVHSQARLEKFRAEFSAAFAQYQGAIRGRDEKQTATAQEQLVKLLDSAKGWNKMASLVAGKLRRVVSPAVLFYVYATRFLGSVILLVLVFASLNLGIAKMNPQAFGGTGIQTVGDAIYFSAVSFFTVGYGDIAPLSDLARWVVVSQIGVALLMLTLLVLSFSTLSAQTTAASAEHLEERARKFLDELTAALSRHFRIDGKPLDEVLEELKKNPRLRWR